MYKMLPLSRCNFTTCEILSEQSKACYYYRLFLENDSKERSIIHAARTNDLTYVPLYWIDNLYNVRPQIGDTLYDINKKPYVITQDFIITHPNDEGMQMIAETIWGVIR